MKWIYLFFISIVLVSCTRDNGFFDEPTLTSLTITSTSAERRFQVMLDDELVKDSLAGNWSDVVPVGKKRLRIRENGTQAFFVDTLIDLPRPKISFSLITLDPAKAPWFFTGFGPEVTAPAAQQAKISFLNMDPYLTKGKKINIQVIDWEGINVLYEFKNIPYGVMSGYFEAPANIISDGGFLEIRDADNPDELIVSREMYNVFMPYAYPPDNIFIVRMTDYGDGTSPMYGFEVIASGKK